MTTFKIENQIQIAATPNRIREALTTHQGQTGWWTTDVECDAERREATFRFARPTNTMAVTFRLDGADEHRVAMTCIRETNNSDWLGTELVFELAPEAGGTRVALVHAGYPAKNEVYDACTKGWAFFLGSLKSYVETGTGQPHTKPAAA